MQIYVGDGLKFDHKTKPFPLQPPTLVADDEEYEEFVLPPPVEMDETDVIINKTVDNIWSKYDTDENGYLDKEEAIKFVKETILDMKD